MSNEAALLENPEVEVEEAPSLRDTLESAFDEAQAAEPAAKEPVAEPVAKEPAAEPVATAPAAKPQDQQAEPATVAKVAGAATDLKAPSQWKPEVREHWNKLPRPVQEEVLRREGDAMRLIGSVGPKIRLADEVNQQYAPFAERLSNAGVTPAAFVKELFTTVGQLSGGSPQDKAEIIANIVQSYGVDLRMLDAALTHRVQMPPEVYQAKQMTARAQAVIEGQQQGQQYQLESQAEQVVQEFGADPKHEFLEDVRDLMADLVESGRVNNLEDAYSAAVWAHPDTRKILLQREAQQRAVSKSNRAQVARRASASVSGSPSLPGGAQPSPNMSLRDSIEAAFDEHSSL